MTSETLTKEVADLIVDSQYDDWDRCYSKEETQRVSGSF